MVCPTRASFHLYLLATFAAGAASLAWTLHLDLGRGVPLIGTRPEVFVVLGACLLAAELRPRTWLSLSDGGEVTGSWTFAFALLFLVPASGVLLAMAVGSVVADLAERKPAVRVAFNAAQVVLSLAVAAAVLDLLSPGGGPAPGVGLAAGWLAAALTAMAVAFLLNTVLTCVVLALHQGLPVWHTVRTSLGVNLMVDGMLLALAPVFALAAVEALVMVPLLLVVVWAVSRSAVLALQNRHDATHDLLTGIPNRRLFEEEAQVALAGASRDGHTLAFLHLDLDGFKAINDRLGHGCGDRVLQEVASRLVAIKRSTDLAARLGGDEFIVLMRCAGGLPSAERAARRLAEELRRPVIVDGVPLAVGASIGVALAPAHGRELPGLLRAADAAMYRAKASGRGVEVWSAEGDGGGLDSLTLASGLRSALDHQEIELRYRPVVEVADGRCIAVEVVAVWHHPRLGPLDAVAAVPVAEGGELSGDLCQSVVGRAVEQCVRWHTAGHRVAVWAPLVGGNLRDPSFASRVESLLLEARLDPAWLWLRVDDDLVAADPVTAPAVLAQLRAAGVHLVLDRFGTGPTRLADLVHLGIHRVRLDPLLVSRATERAEELTVLRGCLELGRQLGFATVADGIDGPDSAELAVALGVDAVQGALVGEAAPASRVESRLRQPVPLHPANSSNSADSTAGPS